MSTSTAYPSPISDTTNAIHLTNSSSDQATKAARECGRREEERKPLLGFAPSIVHADEVKTSRKLSGVSDDSRAVLPIHQMLTMPASAIILSVENIHRI
jgi:hypothetical protein